MNEESAGSGKLVPAVSRPDKPADGTGSSSRSGSVMFFTEKNARAGQMYRSGFQPDTCTNVEILEVFVPDGLGLSYDTANGELAGIPHIPGEHTLTLRYRRLDTRPHHAQYMEGKCILIVNPDPDTLWKNLPSDRDAACWKPDTDINFIHSEEGIKLVAASRRGRSHEHVGSFRDDDFFLDATDGWHILSVADGAGSAKLSRRGAQLAVQVCGAVIKSALTAHGEELEQAAAEWVKHPAPGRDCVNQSLNDILGDAARAAVMAIEAEASTQGNAVKDYATTLILGMHKKIAAGHLVAAFWVGDGGIALYRKGFSVELLGAADSGEFAGQTRFLNAALVHSAEAVMQRLRFAVTPEFTALMLMTDGVSDPKFETEQNLTSLHHWDSFWDELEAPLNTDDPAGSLLAWLSFRSPGNHDDRTLAILWPFSG